MNKIKLAASIIALGIASLNAAHAQEAVAKTSGELASMKAPLKSTIGKVESNMGFYLGEGNRQLQESGKVAK